MKAKPRKVPSRKNQRLTPGAKAAAVVAYLDAGRKRKAGTNLLAAAWCELPRSCAKKAMKGVAGWLEKFLRTGSVSDLPQPGHKPIVSEEDAVAAGQLLVDGQEVKHPIPDKHKTKSRVHFPSFEMAVALSPELAAIKAKYDISSNALLDAIKRHCPDIVWGRLYAKPALSPKHLAERQACAAKLLRCARADGDRTIYVDETKVLLFGTTNDDIKVWRRQGEKHPDAELLHVGGCNFKPFKLCLYAAVNAEMGLVGWQLTTGTTRLGASIKRWPIPGADVGDKEKELQAKPYMVS